MPAIQHAVSSFQAERTGLSQVLHGSGGLSRYWPAETLDAFLLQMAARGHCISAAMMLGDRSYALQQIERARAMPGCALQALVQELSEYFEDAEPAAASVHWCSR
ncbi:hypothetical protein [Paracidovorax valerianellae]|uniref:Uncharacterized protein n=1 Tax=Paracidovorax valerianellae TaxID=187868 RepID=A0A1G6NWE7_9BURK|nr:hypothetical protein [Paracidovorax valerianellae]MDA8444660.1 hypothetical protein [Paracidovorax valerianellae]SDC72078.1 hypothetical protein SAMN05192589_10371 [Paracidovorax valerianellae]